MMMTPGNIVRSLDEMAGLRVQTTSPELGLAIVRMRGLRGQYTRLLSDGVPLYFDLPAGSLRSRSRRWISTGSKSSQAARRRSSARTRWPAQSTCCRAGPDRTANREFLFSQSAPDATDGVLWLSSPPDRIVEPHVPRQRAPAERKRRGRRRLVGHSRVARGRRAPAGVLEQRTRDGRSPARRA